MPKGPKNTIIKQDKQDPKQTAPQNEPQSNKEEDQHRDHRPRTARRINHRGLKHSYSQPTSTWVPMPLLIQKYIKIRFE